MKEITKYDNLSGTERVAVLMLSVGEDNAVRLFEHMSDEEIRDISQTMSRLGNVTSEVVENLFRDFIGEMSTSTHVMGTSESTRRLLSKVMDGDRVNELMEEIGGPAGRTMWEKISNINEMALAGFLKNEYPQTVAVVLSKVYPEQAGKVLAVFPENFAMEVVMRMLRMEPVQKEVLDSVEKTLRNEFISTLSSTQRRDSHEMIADIFNRLDRGTGQRLMGLLEERNTESADRIKGLMFTFEDLTSLMDVGIQRLLRDVDKERLAMALKGASDDLKAVFLRNMSERAGKILQEDMQGLGPVRLRDVDDAQNYMVGIARELADRGEIVIDDGGEDELVY
jgi:flagellar motor switch protein FliG